MTALTAPRAGAITDAEELTRFGSFGSGAGQLFGPTGIATNPTTGHVYVVEGSDQRRISVFTPWGNFVKAFGWDVAPGAVNEQQEVRVRASAGQFKLTFNASSTGDLAFNAPGSASEGPGSVEAALNALPSIADAGGEVSVKAVPGTADGIAPYIYVITFKGPLAGTNVAQLSASNGATPPSGGVPSTTLEARTRADGAAGGTGLESCTEESGCKAGLAGAGAGQFSEALSIAVDAGGNLYVRERIFSGGANNRVQKFDPAGRFISMFGGDVVAFGPNDSSNDEVQEVQIAAGVGTFRLGFTNPFPAGGSGETAPIPYDASAAELKAALEAIPIIASNGGLVSVSGGPGDPAGSSPYQITFEGNLGGDEIPQLELKAGGLAQAVGAELKCETTTIATTISYRWLRDGAPIAGATADTYTTVAADEGSAIQCQVTASNANAGSTQVANPAIVVAPLATPPLAPSDISAPTASAPLTVGGPGGQTLTCDPDKSGWTGAPSFSYQWYRNGVAIAGATASTYVVTTANLASAATFQCAVTGTSAGIGATKVSSNRSTSPEPSPSAPEANASMADSTLTTVNQGGAPEICKAASADACKIGVRGNDPGEFSAEFGGALALCQSSPLCPSGALFAGDKGRIQRFNLDGEYESQLPVPGGVDATAGHLAFDSVSGNLYGKFSKLGVQWLDAATGAEIGTLEGPEGPLPNTGGPLATNSAGSLFAVDSSRVLQFDSAGKQVSSCCEGELLPPPATSGGRFPLRGLGTNAAGDLYVVYSTSVDSFIRLFGPAPVMFEAPPKVPPTISAQFASSVERTGAVLKAEINPHFWTNTRYYVQYGTGKCSEGGCDQAKPVPPGAILTPKVFGSPVRSAGVFLEGLKPGTTYHYRFVAESPGGGPVRGVGGEVGLDGGESSFTTYPAPAPFKADCPNQAFRTGFSAPLANCRAFEMVSPLDKNNGDIKSLLDLPGYTTALYQSSSQGDRFTYSSYRSFANPQAAAWTNQYLASREEGVGWSSEALDPPQAARFSSTSFDNHFKAFSADLCQGWLVAPLEPAPAGGPSDGYASLYRRDNCNGGGLESLIQAAPTIPRGLYLPIHQGASADGEEAIFQVEDKLTENAASGVWQAYYASKGELRLLCVLPNGSPSGGNCSAGTGGGNGFTPSLERLTSLTHAISANGSRVYWTDSAGSISGPGKVYLRLNPGEEPTASGKCEEAEPQKACTLKVSETKTPQPSRFLGASSNGSKAIFEVSAGATAGSLYLFDLEAESSTLIAAKGLGVAGTSEDLSRIYFVSEAVLAGTTGASAAKPNLYLDQEGTKTFIATLSMKDDVDKNPAGNGISNTSPLPIFHVARATPDGSHLAFISTQRLTGYDNTDQATGEADSEVYLYEAGAEGPICVSCSPSGARPQGRVVEGNGSKKVPTASSLITPETQLYSPRVLSSDGSRLFFNSFDTLLPRDTNGKMDVYEWEAASGPLHCTEKGAELYVSSSKGCLSLISSGESPSDSEFQDASPNGNDVFFTTNSSLLPQDPGLIDVYDARANGGLPGPPSPPGPCQGEACQLAPPPPNDQTPASASFRGAGNAVAKKAKSRCAKGKAKRKGRCVAKRQKRAKKSNQARKANSKRRAAR